MRRLLLVTVLALLAAGHVPAAAAGLDRTDFRYKRPLVVAPGAGPVLVEPDGPLYEHAQPAFVDVRFIDARGAQVPWRYAHMDATAPSPAPATVLDSAPQGRFWVTLLDLGPTRQVRDRVALDIADHGFVGRAVVFGVNLQTGAVTRLSETGIYDVGGEFPARSTTAIIPPSDFRYLMVRITGARHVVRATVSGSAERAPLLPRRPESRVRREEGDRTIVTLDFGSRRVPVDELRITTATELYDRPVVISGSNDGDRFEPLTTARLLSFGEPSATPIPLAAQHRFLRIEIANGDDAPLRGLAVSAWSRSRALLLEGGHPSPFTAFYGSYAAPPPDYDFAHLPERVLGLDRPVPARLLGERANPAFEPPPAPETPFLDDHPEVITGALALAALALVGVGLLALGRPPQGTGPG